VTTVLSQTLEGTLFAADPILNIIAIETSGKVQSGQTGDFSVIAVNQISNFIVSALPTPSNSKEASFENTYSNIGPVNTKTAKVRLDGEVKKLQEQEARRGKGVGKEGQDIFDVLVKT
jgi:hypothetical protein